MELEDNKKLLAADTAKRREERNENFSKKKGKKDKRAGFSDIDEHRIKLEELFSRLDVDPNQGLSNGEAADRNAEYGDNALSEKKTPWYIKLLKEVMSPFAILLWICSFLSFVAYSLSPKDLSNFYLGIVLIVVNSVAGIITFRQKVKSEALAEAFKTFIPPRTKVLRGGNFIMIYATKLVPGDIIELKAGDRVPADVRILFAQEMRVDHSSLTGESDPLLRTVECTKENALETENLAFFGTLVTEGIGKGIVIQIGDNTVMGELILLAPPVVPSLSFLRKEINRLLLLFVGMSPIIIYKVWIR